MVGINEVYTELLSNKVNNWFSTKNDEVGCPGSNHPLITVRNFSVKIYPPFSSSLDLHISNDYGSMVKLKIFLRSLRHFSKRSRLVRTSPTVPSFRVVLVCECKNECSDCRVWYEFHKKFQSIIESKVRII